MCDRAQYFVDLVFSEIHQHVGVHRPLHRNLPGVRVPAPIMNRILAPKIFFQCFPLQGLGYTVVVKLEEFAILFGL